MLSYILNIYQNYRRVHGYNPNTIYLNEEHYAVLCEELPMLNDGPYDLDLGFKILLYPVKSLRHPRAAYVLPSTLSTIQQINIETSKCANY